MTRIRINPYGASESVNLLAAAINAANEAGTPQMTCLRLNSDLSSSLFRGRPDDVIVNWGSSREIPSEIIGSALVLNHPTNVNSAANKTTALEIMSNAGVRTVEHTRSILVAQEWVNSGSKVFCRTELRGHSVVGIVVASLEAPEDLGGVSHTTTLPEAPLYTRGIDERHREFRIHVFGDRVMFVQQKRRRTGYRDNPAYSNIVRNAASGWVYAHNNISVPNQNVTTQAIAAVRALGLDFGAVDVLSRGDDAWVLEVNTAPGLSGSTNCENYARMIRGVASGTIPTLVATTVEESPVVFTSEAVATPEPIAAYTSFARATRQNLQIDDTVMISNTSAYYGDGDFNPSDTEGTVTVIEEGDYMSVEVDWDNGTTNTYNFEDLLVRQTTPAPQAGTPVSAVASGTASHRPVWTSTPPVRPVPQPETTTISSFVVGNFVRIATTSQHYGTGRSNPRDVTGEVIDTNGLDLVVRWDNGVRNTYSEDDLVMAPSQNVPTTRRFTIGDVVRIRPHSRYYGMNASNPADTDGEVTSTTGTGGFSVRWSNHTRNTYAADDLILASEVPQEEQTTTAPAETNDEYISGAYYVIEVNNERMVGQYCPANRGFWDCYMELRRLEETTVIRGVSLD